MKRAVFAGTFDPFTLGHCDIVSKVSGMFDELIVGVAKCTGKDLSTTIEDRIKIAELSLSAFSNVKVKAFDGFLVDFAVEEDADYIIRGLRNTKDFEYEKDLYAVYKGQEKNLECIYLIANPEFAHISSSIIRQLISIGGKIDGYVYPGAIELVEKTYRN